jgi:enamine deaminase RidA (YjgF/YER057c/UK114 family)
MSASLDRVRARLRELDLVLPDPVAPKGNYAGARRHDGLLWVSGHTGRTASSPARAGVVGEDVGLDEAQTSARLAAVNLVAAALSVVDTERIADVVFLRGYVRAAPTFSQHPAVVDAASEVLRHVLDGQAHARAAIGVASLPGEACVELEAVLALRPDGQ